ncbi:MAG: hypothetical protein D6805_10410 [Planctomycetota bacterium]|nr:MAG: hypothetical protein D6805_10410 [Planctomycetota bacterium]
MQEPFFQKRKEISKRNYFQNSESQTPLKKSNQKLTKILQFSNNLKKIFAILLKNTSDISAAIKQVLVQ